MIRIREVVQQALDAGYLDLEAENQLRQLLATKYELEDLKSFMRLQLAAMNGQVMIESHKRRFSGTQVVKA